MVSPRQSMASIASLGSYQVGQLNVVVNQGQQKWEGYTKAEWSSNNCSKMVVNHQHVKFLNN